MAGALSLVGDKVESRYEEIAAKLRQELDQIDTSPAARSVGDRNLTPLQLERANDTGGALGRSPTKR